MSRIGNRIIHVPTGVTIGLHTNYVEVSGPKGKLTVPFDSKLVKVEQVENNITVKRTNELKTTKMLHGTINAHISNAITGVTKEFSKDLVFKGVGYKAKVEGKVLALALGFSHPLELQIPHMLRVEAASPTELKIIGPDKQAVGEFCAVIRSHRPPEPYKGKGILFKNEQIIRKTGKKADK